VILSGLDQDGSAALKAFNEGGGITIVQKLDTAIHPQMPQAAIETVTVNYVLEPRAVAGRLEQIAKQLRQPGKGEPGGLKPRQFE